MEVKRVDYTMKILFFFGIIFIVAGHVLAGPTVGGINLGFNMFPPASFHVAIFIFVAGYFYKSKHEATPKTFLKGKLLRLILPLYLINTVYGIWVLVSHRIGFTFGADPTPYNLILGPLFSGHDFWWDCPLWFVAPLFGVEVIDFALRKLLRVGDSKRKEALLIAIYFVAGLITVSLCGSQGFAEGTSSPLLLLARMGFFFPCYAMGRLYRVFLEKHDHAPSWLYFGIIIAIQLVLIVLCGGKITYLVSWCQFYTGRIIPFITTATGIAFWLRVSRILAPSLCKSKVMLLVADNTYSIMAHQFVGIFLVKGAFALASLAGLFSDFDMARFLGDFWYYYYPITLSRESIAGVTAFATLYVAAGVVVPVGIHLLWSKLYGYGKRLRIRNGAPSSAE